MASLFGNIFAGKGVNEKGKGINRAGEGAIAMRQGPRIVRAGLWSSFFKFF